MTVQADTTQQDIRAGLGKDIDNDTGAAPVLNAAGTDTRSAESALGKDDPWTGKTVDQLLEMDPDALLKMSPKDLERAMGLNVGDKSTEEGPEGDAVVHDMDAALASGKATEALDVPATEPAAAPAPAQPAAPAAAPAQAQTPAPAAAAPATEAAPAAEQPFIETPDGKGKISYEVLKGERQRRQALQRELDELRAQQTATPAQPAPAAAPAAAPATPPASAAKVDGRPTLYTEEQIAEFRDQYPGAIAEQLIQANKVSVALWDEVHSLKQKEVQTEEDRAQAVIDQLPLLAKWSLGATQQDQDMWTEATAMDSALRSVPAWAERPYPERYAEVQRRMAAIHGIQIPGTAAPSIDPPPVVTPKLSLQERADAALAAAAAKQTLPTSHSDLPVGAVPAQDERTSIEQLTSTQLEQKFETMTPDQIAAYMAKVA